VKRLFRWLFRLVITAVVLVVAMLLLKDTLLKAWAEWRIHRRTGLEVTIRKFEVGLLTPTFTIEGFRLYNPPQFGGSVLFDIPEVHLEYDPAQAVLGKVRLKLLRFNLQELNVVKNRAGETNLFSVLARSKAAEAGPAGSSKDNTGLDFSGIDRFYLSLGTLKFTDQQQPTNSWQRVIGWKDYEVKNIQTSEDARNWATLLALQILVAPSRPLPPPRSPQAPKSK
jgi:hypothetical protein